MKKLLLVLSAIFVSVMGWGAELDPNTGWSYLNPYAYDLKSEVLNSGLTLRLTYKFNAPGFGNGDEYNKLNPKDGTGTGRGIQIYLLYKDADGNFQRVTKDDGTMYRIVTGGYNAAKEWTVDVNVMDIPNNCKGKELTWEAVVHGNIGRTTPKVVKAASTKPTNAYGIAVNNDPMHVRFAQMFVSEAYPNKRGGWNQHGTDALYQNSNTVLEYNPLLNYVCAHHKHYHDGNKSHFASSWGNGSVYSYDNSFNNEPNRVKNSEDGRVFVSSFHPHAACAVVEYGRNRDSYNGYNYYSVIKNNWGDNDNLTNPDGNNPFLYRRCVGMDVKGMGENLKIILLWIDANGVSYQYSNATQYKAKFEIWEYEVGRAEKEGYLNSSRLHLPPFDTSNGYVHKIGEYTDWDIEKSLGGAFYQGVVYNWNNSYRGFADLAYGANDDVFVKIDYALEKLAQAKIIRVKLSNGSVSKKNVEVSRIGGYYGGSAVCVKDNMLFTGTGANTTDGVLQSGQQNSIHVYEINSTNGELVTDGNGVLKPKWIIQDSQIGKWVTGFAVDYAGNMFVTTEDNTWTSGENYTANVLGIAMPYKKAITTRAKRTFVLPHLASGLEYHPYYDEETNKGDKYKFSFNVDVANPTAVAICFYDTKDKMLKGGDDYSFYYEFSEADRKQGAMSVVFDAVGGTVGGDKFLNNPNENAYLNLPRGEYYWNVRVSRNVTIGSETHTQVDATPASDSYCFVPERISQDMNSSEMANVRNQYEDEGYNLSDIVIYRPMKAGQYNTLCLPFTVDLNLLADNHPYKIGDVFSFSGINYTTSTNAGEDMLELLFEKTTTITTYKPYLFAPKEDITTIQSLGTSITFNEVVGLSDPQYQTEKHNFTDKEGENSINFWSVMYKVTGLYPEDGEVCLILVDKNRLAQVLNQGDMLGFRAFFSLKRLSAGTKVGIAERKTTPTSIIDLHGTEVDVEKFMREGRVYIRVGESLYSLSGERVE